MLSNAASEVGCHPDVDIAIGQALEHIDNERAVSGGAGGGGRTHKPFRATDFKSAAYTDSATPARDSSLLMILRGVRLSARCRTGTRRSIRVPDGLQVGGDDGIRTRDQGFADPCLNHLATSPHAVVWCRGGDLNPYALSGTAPSRRRVYQFHHLGSRTYDTDFAEGAARNREARQWRTSRSSLRWDQKIV